MHDATDEAGPLPKPRCPLLVVVWGPNAAQAQVFTQLTAHRGDVNVAAPRVLAKARHSREGNAFRTGLARVGVSALHAFRRRLQPPTLRKPGLDAVKLKALLVGFLQEYYICNSGTYRCALRRHKTAILLSRDPNLKGAPRHALAPSRSFV